MQENIFCFIENNFKIQTKQKSLQNFLNQNKY